LKKVVVIGDVIQDIIVITQSQTKTNTDNRSQIHTTPGGSGANFAVWLASLGVETELVARVGESDKEQLEQHFRSSHLTPNLQADQELETGKIVILVEGNNRTFYTDRAANTKLDLTGIDFSAASLLYLSGYSVVTLGVEKTQQLIQTAKKANQTVAVDPGSTSFISEFGVSEFLAAITGSDIIFPNLEEFELLSSAGDLGTRFPEVVITKGEAGAELLGVASVPAQSVEIVDPTGAGDAFAAKYIAERLSGTSPQQSLELANIFASLAVTQPGGQPRR
jgi:sugar/nucleoside kinase (ribokinase family)